MHMATPRALPEQRARPASPGGMATVIPISGGASASSSAPAPSAQPISLAALARSSAAPCSTASSRFGATPTHSARSTKLSDTFYSRRLPAARSLRMRQQRSSSVDAVDGIFAGTGPSLSSSSSYSSQFLLHKQRTLPSTSPLSSTAGNVQVTSPRARLVALKNESSRTSHGTRSPRLAVGSTTTTYGTPPPAWAQPVVTHSTMYGMPPPPAVSPRTYYATPPCWEVQAQKMWRCRYTMGVRQSPALDAARVGSVNGGATFWASEELKDKASGITYLKLADGRGWVFDHHPVFGTMCELAEVYTTASTYYDAPPLQPLAQLQEHLPIKTPQEALETTYGYMPHAPQSASASEASPRIQDVTADREPVEELHLECQALFFNRPLCWSFHVPSATSVKQAMVKAEEEALQRSGMDASMSVTLLPSVSREAMVGEWSHRNMDQAPLVIFSQEETESDSHGMQSTLEDQLVMRAVLQKQLQEQSSIIHNQESVISELHGQSKQQWQQLEESLLSIQGDLAEMKERVHVLQDANSHLGEKKDKKLGRRQRKSA